MGNPNIPASKTLQGDYTFSGNVRVLGSFNQGAQQQGVNTSTASGLLTPLAGTFTQPGTIWNNVANPFTGPVDCLAAGINSAGAYIVVGGDANGNVAYSLDNGETWSGITQPLGVTVLGGATYGQGVWIICGANGKIAYTSNPAGGWTVVVVTAHNLDALGYGVGVFMVGDTLGNIYYSTTNGVAWSAAVATGLSTVYNIQYGNSIWIAAGILTAGNTSFYSLNNGVTWPAGDGNPLGVAGGQGINGLSYGAGIFFAVAGTVAKVATSSNGSTWTVKAIPVSDPKFVQYGNGPVVIAGVASGNICLSSDNGITWQLTASTGGYTYLASICFANSTFVMGGVNAATGAGLIMWSSWLSYGKSYLYVPVFTSFGTVTAISFFWQRKPGSNTITVMGKFTMGVNVAAEARVGLPVGLISDSALITSIQSCSGLIGSTEVSASVYVILIESGVGYVTFGNQSAARAGLTKIFGNVITNNTTFSLEFELPISGWN